MIKIKISLLVLVLAIGHHVVNAQSEVKEYSISKGQVFDIIFLTNQPDVKGLLQDYFKRAFPIAEAHGYHSLGGYGIAANDQGNYLPETMVFGYWDSLDGREKFLKAVDIQMTDFHEMRRKIWPTFNLTYYEMNADLSFNINPTKYNTVTAYWEKDAKDFEKFKQTWLEKSKKAGGIMKVEFAKGQSPFGYYYNPNFLAITEWESKEAFEKFHSQNIVMDHKSVQHVNQFSLK